MKSLRLKRAATGALATLAIVAASTIVGTPIAASAADPAPELIGQWSFDDLSFASGAAGATDSDTAVLDPSNCTVPSSSTNVPPSLGTGRSLSLNGTGCLVITNPFRAVSGVHDAISSFTICSWINTTSQGTGTNHWNSAPILDGEVGGVSNDFGFGLSETGKLTFGTGRANGTNDERIDGTTTVNDGRWHHVCVTRDAAKSTGNVLLYVDGALDESTSSNGLGGSNQDAPTASAIAHLGWGQDDYHNKFVGFMDDMRAYEGVLDSAAINNLYAGSSDPLVSSDGEAAGTGDGVLASIENAAPNAGDANADGLADSIQRNIASLPNVVDRQYTTLALSSGTAGCALSAVTNTAAAADAGYSYLAGLTRYAADCAAGYTAQLTLYQYGETCDRLAVRSYDPASGTYSTVTAATIRQVTIDGTIVAVASFDLPGGSAMTGTIGIAESTSACPVSPLNPLPTITIAGSAAPDSVSDHTNTNTTWSLELGASRTVASSFGWGLSSPAAFGTATTSTASGSSTTLQYVPQSGFIGTDRFTVRLSDGAGGFDYLAVELAIGPQLVNVTAPAISVSGGLRVFDTLSMSSTGSWNFAGTSGSGTRYQWYKIRGTSRTAIIGATGADLALTPDLVGADLVVEVTAWARFCAPASVTSVPVGPVEALDFATEGSPTVSGTARVGQMMEADADVDGWTPVPDDFSYQWFADGVAISGATARSYRIAPGEAGSVLTVAVTASRVGWNSAGALSDSSAQVEALELRLEAPSSGVAVAASPAQLAVTGVSDALVVTLGAMLALITGGLVMLAVGRRGGRRVSRSAR